MLRNLLSAKDYHIVALVSTWENIENWREWERSKIRQDILRQAVPLLVEEPKSNNIYNHTYGKVVAIACKVLNNLRGEDKANVSWIPMSGEVLVSATEADFYLA